METAVSRNSIKSTHESIFQTKIQPESSAVPGWMKKNKPGPLGGISESTAALLGQKKKRPSANFLNNPERSAPSAAQETRLKNNPGQSQENIAAPLTPGTSLQSGQVDTLQSQSSTALREVGQALIQLQQTRTALLGELEPQLLALSTLIVERVLNHQLPQENELARRLVHEAIESLDEQETIRITLGTGFADEVSSLEEQLERAGLRAEVRVKKGLALYACEVRTDLGFVDESVATRLDHIIASLDQEQNEE